ncbi:MAG: hypothetical protein CVT63_01240 [Candidatus Anoxymicrobium japonicum]|uniref:Uncharacterized protein n=1 Tax=Candidatus Anoxymicrobium japonicum TaxID=2013648 RepID=A0A2N3G7V1_9ACTN|nr:MAG: hypothetical protein CVT63_01240 [Candidatus Anoxymicrobium japonicum]
MKRCPEHLDEETMVSCMDCGRDFCRVCNPMLGAGQWCPICYDRSLKDLTAKETGDEKRKKRGRLRISLRNAAVFTKKHFPISFSQKISWEGEPPLVKAWPGFLVAAIGGGGLWMAAVLLTRRRLAIFSICVALLVACAVVRSLGVKYGVATAVLASATVMLALVAGELIVQLLYRLEVIRKLDLVRAWANTPNSRIYAIYYKKLLLARMLPAVVIAFIVGWWPLKRKLGWKGFST